MTSLASTSDVLRRGVAQTAPGAARSTAPHATVRAAVVGVGGYAGGELARLLLQHPRLRASHPLFFGRPETQPVSAPELLETVHPQLAGTGTYRVLPFSWSELERAGTELVFFATPHEQSHAWVPEALARGLRVIDLSGAWRLREAENRAPYGFNDDPSDTAAALQREAVYGCPELDSGRIAGASLVANPGCYATSILLALAPLLRAGVVDLTQEIICDAKSGVSGAGKAPTAKTHFLYAADNLSAYSVFDHRHTGELLEQLALAREQIRFTPHLLPIPRGILSSIYLRSARRVTTGEILGIFTEFYRERPLVRVRSEGVLPQIQYVVRTNYCDLGAEVDRDGRRVFVVSCLDNLLKGAAGQAVQNMNLMYGWDETEGLL